VKDESKGQQQAEFSREKGKNGGGWNLELGAWGLGQFTIMRLSCSYLIITIVRSS
jgi:hypothetical protein